MPMPRPNLSVKVGNLHKENHERLEIFSSKSSRWNIDLRLKLNQGGSTIHIKPAPLSPLAILPSLITHTLSLSLETDALFFSFFSTSKNLLNLRTWELLNLRPPPLRDEAVIRVCYKKNIKIQDGTVKIQRLRLQIIIGTQ